MNLPNKFIERMKDLLGDEFDKYQESLTSEPYRAIRFNTFKINDIKIKEKFSNLEEKVSWMQNGYYITKDFVSKHPFYHAGLYYIQEPSAMLPAKILPIEEGDKVLDLCAAPGGKSTQLANRLNGQGFLIANDISNSRAKGLLKNIELFGISNCIVMSEDPKKLAGYFKGYFDKILIDAPCSGEGMIRKDPNILKSLETKNVSYYEAIQQELILLSADMLKSEGYMVYSTCTFSPEENEGIIAYLLSNRPEFTIEKCELYEGFDTGKPNWLDKTVTKPMISDDILNSLTNCIRLWPHKIKGEGHFVALLKKNGNKSTAKTKEYPYQKNKSIPELQSFMDEFNIKLNLNQIEIQNERVYYLPEHLPNLKGLRLLRSGLYLGDLKKNRFEPSQALAMTINPNGLKRVISFDSQSIEVIKYLKGETVELSTQYALGWNLICVEGYPLGFGKVTGSTLKNKYYSGWIWR